MKTTLALLLVVSQGLAQQTRHYTINWNSVDQVESAYSIKGGSPRIEGLSDSLVQSRCNSHIDSLIGSWIEPFKSDAMEAYKEDTTRMATSYLEIDFSVSLATDQLLSLVLQENGMITWNAHPASESSTLAFDLSTGNQLRLEDLFEVQSRFLDTLSRYCIMDLLSQGAANDEALARGASPNQENFENFALDEEFLTIIFNVYQVDSYGNAPGGFIVEIPYKYLSSVLRKNGPIGSLLR